MFKIQNQPPVSKIGLSIYSDLSTNILELFQKIQLPAKSQLFLELHCNPCVSCYD